MALPRLRHLGPRLHSSISILGVDDTLHSLAQGAIGWPSTQSFTSLTFRQDAPSFQPWHGARHAPPCSQLVSLRHFAASPGASKYATPGNPQQPPDSGGWTRREVFNLANGLSLGRLLSGPLLAACIVKGQWAMAVPGLAVSGATDWLDGYVARRAGLQSVLGSYLDPLADKVLVGCVVGALGYTGALPAPLVAVILGRDVFLVAGAFVVRAQMLRWRWPGATEFFRIMPAAAPPAAAAPDMDQPDARGTAALQGRTPSEPPVVAVTANAVPAAPVVQPLFISKVNTGLQLALVGSCMMDAWLGWPGEGVLWGLGAATGVTTVWTCGAYVRAYSRGQLLAMHPKA